MAVVFVGFAIASALAAETLQVCCWFALLISALPNLEQERIGAISRTVITEVGVFGSPADSSRYLSCLVFFCFVIVMFLAFSCT